MSDRTLTMPPALAWARVIAAALGLSLLLAISAHVQVPFWPVPMTLQTLAVLAIGGLLGPRMAAAAMLTYLAEGAAGLPVFAGTPAHGIGLAYMAGPTGGYLLGLLLAAGFAGWAGRRFARSPLLLGAAMLGAVALNYAPGVAWLATFVGWQRAVALGAAPFLLADLVKAALATTLVLATAGGRRA